MALKMNFDTRTVLDLILLDNDLEIVLNAMVDAEKVIWHQTGKTSQNDFVKSVIPLVRDELSFYLKHRLHRMKLGFLRKHINLDKVDYYHLIPAVAKI
jgi:hypothetical protein